jgi:hypothetical protein
MEKLIKCKTIRKRMKELQERFSLRKEIETTVISCNKFLRDEVKFMTLYILLCNCHPLYRSDYARKLFAMGKLSENQAKEFYKY